MSPEKTASGGSPAGEANDRPHHEEARLVALVVDSPMVIPSSTAVRHTDSKLERRVVEAAEAALERQQYVTAIDVLVGVGWLTPQAVEQWRQGRVAHLERVTQANLHKLSAAMAIFRPWARDRGLRASETAYVARTRDRRPLQFSRSGDAAIERAYRTHWISPTLSETKVRRLANKLSRPPDLVVVSAFGNWTCTTCSDTGDLLFMEGPGPLCLRCADLDYLVYLAAGDAALTRRAKKASGLSAVVVRFSRTRGRYERQGLLVEDAALIQAEAQCLADEEARNRRRLRDEARRLAHDGELQTAFAGEITRLFPGSPPERALLPSPATLPKEAVAGWAGAQPAAPLIPRRSPSPSSHRCATSTPPTTSC